MTPGDRIEATTSRSESPKCTFTLEATGAPTGGVRAAGVGRGERGDDWRRGRIGAIERACRAEGLRRVNYEILGNTDASLHAHVFPRYDWEPTEHASMPIWLYPRDRWTDARFAYSAERHGVLRRQITAELTLLMRSEASEGVDEPGGSKSVLALRAGGAPR